MTSIQLPENNILINLSKKPVIFDYMSNGIFITDTNSKILYTNSAFTKTTGYTSEEVLGKNPEMFHSGKHDKTFYHSMWEDINQNGYWEGEIWNRKKSGEVYPKFLAISKIEQNNSGNFLYIAIFSDISFLKADYEQKLHLAFYDPLTELPNRNLFLDRIHAHRNNKNTQSKNKFVAFFMDLDNFKQINRTYGYLVGDTLLKMVGQRLVSVTRSEDTIARIDDDVFAAIIVSNSDHHNIMDSAKRILNAMEKPFVIEKNTIHISISIGIAFYPSDNNNVDILLKNAEKAMHFAKQLGSKIECWETSMESR